MCGFVAGSGRRERLGLASPFNSALQGVVDGVHPVVQVLF